MIISDKPSAPPKQLPSPPIIEPKKSHSVILDNSKVPIDSLITHVSGIALTVDYYRLIVNKDTALYSQDVGQSGVQQQYQLYKNFEIRQTGSLSQDQDTEDKVFTVVGTGIVHSGLIPNEGDMFSCDVGDGRLGVFNIKRSQQLSIAKATTYQIEYGLSYFTDNKKANYDDLKSKVIETYYYVKERLNFNESPFLTTDEYNFYIQLGTYYHNLLINYRSWFFSKEYMAYIVPDQNSSTFDYFIYRALQVLFRDDYTGVMQKHQGINISDDDIINRKFDLLSILLERSKERFNLVDQRVGTTRTNSFNFEGVTSNIRYTGIRSLVYPISSWERTDTSYNTNFHPILEGPLTASPPNRHPNISKELVAYTFGQRTVPLIKLVSIDDYYIFSEDFYKRTTNLSLIEDLVLKYIDGEQFNHNTLKVLLDNYQYWPNLERFYYMPILMILIQSILKDL